MQFDIVDYVRLVTQKIVVGVIIGLAARVTVVKMIEAEGLVLEAADVDRDIHKEMAVHLVCCLVVLIFNIEYPLILYHKLLQFV